MAQTFKERREALVALGFDMTPEMVDLATRNAADAGIANVDFIQGTIEDILTGEFHHPYTLGLLGSIPNLEEDTDRLKPIPGLMPPPNALPEGCRFHPRCEHCMEICKHRAPEHYYEHEGHYVACHLFGKEAQDHA